VRSNNTPPPRPQPLLTNRRAITRGLALRYRAPSIRSVTPVASAKDRRSARSRVASDKRARTAQMYAAEMKKETESIMKAVLRPKASVTTPPSAAPRAKVTDHDAADNAFAGISSCRETMFGTAADFAGSKKVDTAISN